MDHEILLSKLSLYGINGIAHQWFQSYLEDRTQMCSINGHLSSSCSLSCGVPQGTVLEPLLFLLYINDLPNCLSNSEPRMYADDTHPTYATNNRLQNRAARVLTFSDYDEGAGYLFELLGWKNLARQHEIEKATMV